MFTPEKRGRLLEQLVDAARADGSVVAAALVGSLAAGRADRWSDIDLALRLAPGIEPSRAVRSWTLVMQGMRPVADRLDVWSGSALYRVFLLADSLQVDLSFWPYESFASTGEPFELLFGAAGPARSAGEWDPGVVIGWAWLYALHTRSAISRGRYWQALQMVDDLRAQLVVLACLRHGLPPQQGRGVDRLPAAELDALSRMVPERPDRFALLGAFDAALERLGVEASRTRPDAASGLGDALTVLRSSVAADVEL